MLNIATEIHPLCLVSSPIDALSQESMHKHEHNHIVSVAVRRRRGQISGQISSINEGVKWQWREMEERESATFDLSA